nr:MAG TPA: hypothetical protein [Caudoviricetes sp.]
MKIKVVPDKAKSWEILLTHKTPNLIESHRPLTKQYSLYHKAITPLATFNIMTYKHAGTS